MKTGKRSEVNVAGEKPRAQKIDDSVG